jgi:hypothetical protein
MELATEHLVLRPVDLDDLDFYVELRNQLDSLASPRREPRSRGEVGQGRGPGAFDSGRRLDAPSGWVRPHRTGGGEPMDVVP